MANFEVHYKNKSASILLMDALEPFFTENIVLACIGTDKCLGDSLGPLIGTLLKQSSFSFPVYGTLEHPIHALNLETKMQIIKKRHPHSTIIAIDACLDNESSIGIIELKPGPIYPGKGLGKTLNPVGDLSIIGIVDSLHDNPKISLHSIRLSLVWKMAHVIVNSLLPLSEEISTKKFERKQKEL